MFIHLCIAAFFAILFLQSGVDKVVDWQGNLGWLTGHFEKSLFKDFVKPLLGIITLLELLAGGVSAVGAVQIVLSQSPVVAQYGLALCGVALVSLFFGQRLAKDYEGAATIASYFTLCLVGMYLLTLS